MLQKSEKHKQFESINNNKYEKKMNISISMHIFKIFKIFKLENEREKKDRIKCVPKNSVSKTKEKRDKNIHIDYLFIYVCI